MTILEIYELIIAIKGAGEIASGIAVRLFRSNFTNIFMMEIPSPMAVRRQVSFCEAVYDGTAIIEGIKAQKVLSADKIKAVWNKNHIPVIVDPDWNSIKTISPDIVIDAVIAKKNLGTNIYEAPLVIGLGPGFEAGEDVHCLIETNRGHNLGKLILKGFAEPDTGIPGNIKGHTKKRVLRSPCSGIFTSCLTIGAIVKKNDILGYVDNLPVIAQIDGILRGQIRNNTRVTNKLKTGDIDHRGNIEYCHTISDKALAIAGGVLEAILRKYN